MKSLRATPVLLLGLCLATSACHLSAGAKLDAVVPVAGAPREPGYVVQGDLGVGGLIERDWRVGGGITGVIVTSTARDDDARYDTGAFGFAFQVDRRLGDPEAGKWFLTSTLTLADCPEGTCSDGAPGTLAHASRSSYQSLSVGISRGPVFTSFEAGWLSVGLRLSASHIGVNGFDDTWLLGVGLELTAATREIDVVALGRR